MTGNNRGNRNSQAQQPKEAVSPLMAVQPPEPQSPPQIQAFPAIQGVFNYMGFSEDGRVFKVNEDGQSWRIANEEDFKILLESLSPVIQKLMASSIPNYASIIPQLQSILKNQ